jgi:hypothetical protein
VQAEISGFIVVTVPSARWLPHRSGCRRMLEGPVVLMVKAMLPQLRNDAKGGIELSAKIMGREAGLKRTTRDIIPLQLVEIGDF